MNWYKSLPIAEQIVIILILIAIGEFLYWLATY